MEITSLKELAGSGWSEEFGSQYYSVSWRKLLAANGNLASVIPNPVLNRPLGLADVYAKENYAHWPEKGANRQGIASDGAERSSDAMRPAGDPHFSAEEQRMVAAARAYLENGRQKPLDARYRVERTKEGYEVFAMFVSGYENGQPLYSPGGHGIVVLRQDGSVVRYLPGE